MPEGLPDGSEGFAYLRAMLSQCEAQEVHVRFLLDHFDLTEENVALSMSFFSALRSLCSSQYVSLLCATRKPLFEIRRREPSLGSPLYNMFLSCYMSSEAIEGCQLLLNLGR